MDMTFLKLQAIVRSGRSRNLEASQARRAKIVQSHMMHPLQEVEVIIPESLLRRLDVPGPRYTSYPTADRFVEAFGEPEYRQALRQRQQGATVGGSPPLSLYVHVPFCESVCYYCACNKVITKHHDRAVECLDALDTEIGLAAASLGSGQPGSQLHFGGGSPTSNLHCLPGRICCGLAMYITDLTHLLDKSGAIGPVKGPARAMAQFHVDAVARASDSMSVAPPRFARPATHETGVQ